MAAYSCVTNASSSLTTGGCGTSCTTSSYYTYDSDDTASYVSNTGDYVTIKFTTSTNNTYSATSIKMEIIDSVNTIYSGAAYSDNSFMYIMKLGGYFDSSLMPCGPKQVKKEALRAKIRGGMASTWPFSARFLPRPNEEEERARKLLLSLVGEERYRLYLKRGFVVEQGKSGLKYKIRPGHSMVEVLHPKKDGKFFKFRSLCIQPKVDGLPPTDAVIMRLLLVRHDEFAMQKLSNVTVLATPSVEDERGVSEFLKEKVA